jgi:signal transduction histidine kinase
MVGPMPSAASSYRVRLAVARPGLYPVVRTVVELLFAAAFVVGVYELIVRGGIALWPNATDDWILPMWIAAATISGLGLTPVRGLARRLLARLWPSGADDPYAALASFAVAASAAEPAEDALRGLARLAATGTGARSAAVWLAGPDGGLRLGGQWPDDGEPVDIELADHRIPVAEAGAQLGALSLVAPLGRELAPRDLRLAGDAANAAGQLLRNAELTARLAEEVRRESGQAAELDRSRRRVLAARDAAREQLGREIRARVGEPLYQCSSMASALLDGDLGGDAGKADGGGVVGGVDSDGARSGGAEPGGAGSGGAEPGGAGVEGADARKRTLAEMTDLIDTAIRDFRRIVHGVYPAVLTDHGLAAALENLLADLPQRTVFTARDLPRLAPRIESGVYFCVAALVGSPPEVPAGTSSDQPLEVAVELDNGAGAGTGVGTDTGVGVLRVVLLDPRRGGPAAPEVLRDRIEALEGEIQTMSTDEGLRSVLTVPLTVETDAT